MRRNTNTIIKQQQRPQDSCGSCCCNQKYKTYSSYKSVTSQSGEIQRVRIEYRFEKREQKLRASLKQGRRWDQLSRASERTFFATRNRIFLFEHSQLACGGRVVDAFTNAAREEERIKEAFARSLVWRAASYLITRLRLVLTSCWLALPPSNNTRTTSYGRRRRRRRLRLFLKCFDDSTATTLKSGLPSSTYSYNKNPFWPFRPRIHLCYFSSSGMKQIAGNENGYLGSILPRSFPVSPFSSTSSSLCLYMRARAGL